MKTQLWCSNIAAAVNLDKWRQPYEVWDMMHNESLREETPPTPNQVVGKAMEPVIAQLAEQDLGPLEYVDARRLESKALPWLSGRVEYLTKEGYPVDCKNVGINMMDEYDKDSPSIRAELAMRGYLALMDADFGFICAWLGGSTYRYYQITRDMDKEAHIAFETERFVQSVLDGEPPDIDTTHRSAETIIKALFPDVTETEITLDENVLNLLQAKDDLSKRRNSLDKGVTAIDLEIKLRVGNAFRAWLPDGSYIERKKVHVKERTQEAFDYVRIYHKTVKA